MRTDCLVAVVVLAAGGSRRMGLPKQLLTVNGTSLVRLASQSALDARVGPVAAVLGAHAGDIAAEVADLPVTVVPNSDWEEGIASSLRCGVAWAATVSDAVLIVAVDQPYVTAIALQAITEKWRAGGNIIASEFSGTFGPPILFDRQFFAEISALTGDTGAKRVALTHPSELDRLRLDAAAIDIDTLDDYRRLNAT